MSPTKFSSWGLLSSTSNCIFEPHSRLDASEAILAEGVIFASGRSYSDIALPLEGKRVTKTSSLNHFISYDRKSGVIEVEAGVTLREIQKVTLKDGWGLAVLPGTSYVTVGGALANDIHGKNHHSQGAFSLAVESFTLLRSSSKGVEVVTKHEKDLWRATVGGLGVTGLILTVKLKLKRWSGGLMRVKQSRFVGIDEYIEISKSSSEYTVGWIDALSNPVRGVFFEGDHQEGEHSFSCLKESRVISNPLPTIKWIGRNTTKLFNEMYWIAHQSEKDYLVNWQKFFFPLDNINGWNTLYGKEGFQQFQCRLPFSTAKKGLAAIFKACQDANLGSFLSVIKSFGSIPSEGVLSFANEGVTFAMDFPQEKVTNNLIEKLCWIVLEHEGGLYPAKVCIPNSKIFIRAFPDWEEWYKLWSYEFGNCSSIWLNRVMRDIT